MPDLFATLEGHVVMRRAWRFRLTFGMWTCDMSDVVVILCKGYPWSTVAAEQYQRSCLFLDDSAKISGAGQT